MYKNAFIYIQIIYFQSALYIISSGRKRNIITERAQFFLNMDHIKNMKNPQLCAGKKCSILKLLLHLKP